MCVFGTHPFVGVDVLDDPPKHHRAAAKRGVREVAPYDVCVPVTVRVFGTHQP